MKKSYGKKSHYMINLDDKKIKFRKRMVTGPHVLYHKYTVETSSLTVEEKFDIPSKGVRTDALYPCVPSLFLFENFVVVLPFFLLEFPVSTPDSCELNKNIFQVHSETD